MKLNVYYLRLILVTRTQKWNLQINSSTKPHVLVIIFLSSLNKHVIFFLHFIYLKLCLTLQLIVVILMYRAIKCILHIHINENSRIDRGISCLNQQE